MSNVFPILSGLAIVLDDVAKARVAAMVDARAVRAEAIVAEVEMLAAHGVQLPLSLVQLCKERQEAMGVILAACKKAALQQGIDVDDPEQARHWTWDEAAMTFTRSDGG